MVTPEYVRRVTKELPLAKIFAARLDRGMSSDRALQAGLGEHADEERGLNDKQYIVPGAGGIGEILNNSFV
jgi:uracil phosphoribosyltransferase